MKALVTMTYVCEIAEFRASRTSDPEAAETLREIRHWLVKAFGPLREEHPREV